MSTLQPTPESTSPPFHPSKPQRVLACVLCQQRKVRCDRKVPCANCIKSRVQCVPAAVAPRQRRRRFPERELLDRLRKYEDLLRQNNIKFEPLHKDSARQQESSSHDGGYDSDDEQPELVAADGSPPSTVVRSERVYVAKNIWHTMTQGFRDADNASDSSHDDVREVDIKTAWDHIFETHDDLLFGTRKTAVDLSTIHPEPVQIFRLWQIYLDNIDPLLKVTHIPSLQGRIVEAISKVTNICPPLEALMFSIYCMSILSLDADDCLAVFGSSQEDLLTRYQFGCQQALLNSGFLRCSDRDCLTALYFYLVSVRSSTVPQSLSSMLGVAIRIAQRMGIHSESSLAKCTVLEAEMRRRLWWSLILFDTRIGEIADSKSATLIPTWDCKVPLNADDSDLRLEMKEPPSAQGKSTEALFAVVRSELGDFVRHATFFLELYNPALKPTANVIRHGLNPEGGELAILEEMIEGKYLKLCDPENPLHFMTIWMTRGYLAKCNLLEHNLRLPQTELQRDAATFHAFRMLESDTRLLTSPLTKRFFWLVHLHFPFPAYLQIAQDMKRRPGSGQAGRAWEIMSENYEARFVSLHKNEKDHHPWFRNIFTKIILQAWEAREAAFSQSGEPLMPPRIVSSMRHKLAQIARNAQVPNGAMGTDIANIPMSMPMGSDSNGLLYNMEGQGGYGVDVAGAYPDIPGYAPLGLDPDSLDWAGMDWGLEGAYPGTFDL